jgi:WD40 repeat protein
VKKSWTRAEKWLFAAPLLFVFIAVAFKAGPEMVRRARGYPTQLPTAPGHRVMSLSLSGDGRVLVASELVTSIRKAIHSVRLWDARTLKPLPPLQTRSFPGRHYGHGANAVALSPDAKVLAWGAIGNGIRVADLKTRRQLWSIDCDSSNTVMSPNGRWLALKDILAPVRHSVEIFEVRSGKMVAGWTLPPSESKVGFAFSPRGRYFASTGSSPQKAQWHKAPNQRGGEIEVRRVTDWKIERVLPLPNTNIIAFSPDECSLVGISRIYDVPYYGITVGSRLRCFDFVSGQIKWELNSRKPGADPRLQFIQDACYSPDNRWIAILTSNSGIYLLDARTGQITRTLPLPADQIANCNLPHGLSFSPDGQRLFARGNDAVLVWDLKP